MKIIAYARASDEAQQITLRDQQEKLRQYAALYDHSIVEMVVGTESAKTIDKRDEFQRVLQLLRDGAADGLLVLKLDRLARDVGDGAHLLKMYFGEDAKYGKHLFSVMDYVDTRTPNGRMVFNMLLVIAQWERETISARTKAALRYKIKNGERVGKLPYGYDLAEDGKTLIENHAEQDGLAFMRQLAVEGRKLRDIATAMAEAGYRTKQGKPLNFATISRLLKRPQSSDAA